MNEPQLFPVSGQAAEDAAAEFLKAEGYVLLARNFVTRSGEVDIVAADGNTICFVEVRSLADDAARPPYTTIGRRKQVRIRAAAAAYLNLKRLHNSLCRFDIVSLVPCADSAFGWKVELLRDAF